MQDYLLGTRAAPSQRRGWIARGSTEGIGMILDAFDRMMGEHRASDRPAQLAAQRAGTSGHGAGRRRGPAHAAGRPDRTTKMAHANEFAKTAQTSDPTQCNYWRQLFVGRLSCSCCGGTYNECPPGLDRLADQLDRHLRQPGQFRRPT